MLSSILANEISVWSQRDPVFHSVWMEIFVGYLKIWFLLRGHTICSVFCLVGNHRRGLTSILRLYCVDRYLKASLFVRDHQTDDDNLHNCWYNPAGGSFEILRGMIPFIICSLFGIFFCLLVFNWQKLDTLSTRFFIPVLWIIKSEHLQVHITKQFLLIT